MGKVYDFEKEKNKKKLINIDVVLDLCNEYLPDQHHDEVESAVLTILNADGSYFNVVIAPTNDTEALKEALRKAVTDSLAIISGDFDEYDD